MAAADRLRLSRMSAIAAAVVLSVAAASGVAHIAGAAVSSGDRNVFVPVEPCRLMDTRASRQIGPRGTKLGAGETYAFQVTGANGDCDIPPEATAVVGNLTAVGATASSNLRLWPADTAEPTSSNLNVRALDPPRGNKVTVGLSSTGQVKIKNAAGTVDVLLDVFGYYAHHDHDDRYYTKTEVDDLLAGGGDGGGGVGCTITTMPDVPMAQLFCGDTTALVPMYPDADLDGYPDSTDFTIAADCDAENPAINQGALEVEDDVDNDCDGLVDESNFDDVDMDGYLSDVDCDDTNSTINPGAEEMLDGIDNNCDGQIDENLDLDMDGWAAPEDCDDANSSTYPGATEFLDGIDNNCDGQIDENLDLDMDGWAAPDDCDDTDWSVFPGASEVLDGTDNDCDGLVDEGFVTVFPK